MATTPGSTMGDAPMTPGRWRAVDAILQGALELEPARRAAFVAEACVDDAALRREVESLLAVAPAGDFLEQPAVPATPVAARLAAATEGRYVVERELGRGGMATVHLARDPRHHRRVAIKVLREELSAALGAERFLKEIEVTASLQHPHILPLFDSGSAEGLLYYVMPHVEGETLRARLAREGPLPADEAVRLACEVADALEHAHRRGVVHRDVKPENVLLHDGTGTTHALVADFGIALAIQQAGGARLTRTGLSLGTPQYMAPEQATGDRAVDARADVYALGAVLYEMLAGESPFAAPTLQAVVARVMTEPPRSLALRQRAVPPHVEAAVRKALEKRPADRFPSAAAFAAALADPSSARRATGARTVAVGTMVKLAAAALAAGLAGGWALARSPLAGRVASPTSPPSPASALASALVLEPGGPPGGDLALAVMDRAGREQRRIEVVRPWTPRLSPDGRRVAYGAFAPGRGRSDVWVTDLDAGTTRQLTSDDADGNDPVWSPDGRTLAWSALAPGGKDILAQRLDATTAAATARTLARRAGNQFPSDWLPDGSALLVTDESRGNQDVWVQPADGSPARPLVATDADESSARVSPDGRWVAYVSNATGKAEVWVQPYAGAGRPVRVSTSGGVAPAWRGDGRELYYWEGDQLVAVQLDATGRGGTALVVRGRTPLFRAPYHAAVNAMWDVSRDGSRFVVVVER